MDYNESHYRKMEVLIVHPHLAKKNNADINELDIIFLLEFMYVTLSEKWKELSGKEQEMPKKNQSLLLKSINDIYFNAFPTYRELKRFYNCFWFCHDFIYFRILWEKVRWKYCHDYQVMDILGKITLYLKVLYQPDLPEWDFEAKDCLCRISKAMELIMEGDLSYYSLSQHLNYVEMTIGELYPRNKGKYKVQENVMEDTSNILSALPHLDEILDKLDSNLIIDDAFVQNKDELAGLGINTKSKFKKAIREIVLPRHINSIEEMKKGKGRGFTMNNAVNRYFKENKGIFQAIGITTEQSLKNLISQKNTNRDPNIIRKRSRQCSNEKLELSPTLKPVFDGYQCHICLFKASHKELSRLLSMNPVSPKC